MAVNDAIFVYNEGELGRIEILKKLGLSCGYYSISAFRQFDEARIKAAEEGNKMKIKIARARKSVQTAAEYPEDDSYAAGAH